MVNYRICWITVLFLFTIEKGLGNADGRSKEYVMQDGMLVLFPASMSKGHQRTNFNFSFVI